MQLSEAIRKRILELMKENNIKTINAVTNLAGISNTLNDFMLGNVELLKLDTLLHICEAFNIELKDFFNSPVFENVIDEKDNNI